MTDSLPTTTALRHRNASARRQAVLELVREQGFSRIVDLSERLGVSPITVRRDIALLEQNNLVRGTHGGAIAVAPSAPGGGGGGGGTHFQLRAGEHSAEKRAIARKAIQVLNNRGLVDILGVDAGTTALDAARLLSPDAPLTVLTHSLPVMMELADRPNMKVVGIGGVLHPETMAFAGSTTIAAYSRVRIQTLLLTASAIRGDTMYCGNSFDGDTKRQMMDVADDIILLADSSKFHRAAPFEVENLSRVNTIVIDDEAPIALRDELRRAGLEVVIAESP